MLSFICDVVKIIIFYNVIGSMCIFRRKIEEPPIQIHILKKRLFVEF